MRSPASCLVISFAQNLKLSTNLRLQFRLCRYRFSDPKQGPIVGSRQIGMQSARLPRLASHCVCPASPQVGCVGEEIRLPIKAIFHAIRQLMASSEPKKRKVGFLVEEKRPPTDGASRRSFLRFRNSATWKRSQPLSITATLGKSRSCFPATPPKS